MFSAKHAKYSKGNMYISGWGTRVYLPVTLPLFDASFMPLQYEEEA